MAESGRRTVCALFEMRPRTDLASCIGTSILGQIGTA